jgi:hypothetical protein
VSSREQLGRVQEQLEAEEGRLSRLVITTETVEEILARRPQLIVGLRTLTAALEDKVARRWLVTVPPGRPEGSSHGTAPSSPGRHGYPVGVMHHRRCLSVRSVTRL